MKKQILLIALIFGSLWHCANAQISFHLNLGTQPLWGPTGYDYAQYYYIPDIDAYYDVANQEYVYYNGSQWIYSPSLPPQYAGIDLYSVHKVVINRPTPWLHHDRDLRMYYSFRGRHDQPVIRDSRDYRYWSNPAHPRHNEWHGAEEHRDWGGNRPHEMHHEDRGGHEHH